MDGCVLWTGAFCGRVRSVDGCVLWMGAFCGRVHSVDGCILWTDGCSEPSLVLIGSHQS